MTMRQLSQPGPSCARSCLRLPNRLTIARSGKLANQWTVPRHRCGYRSHVHRHRMCCKRSDTAEDPGLLNLRVQILIKEGDSLESLSAKYDIPESKLRQANGGQPEVTPGTELVIIQKVPSNLMPTPQNKLVPIEAAYSDDEGEVALVKENKQILDEQAQLAQFYGVQTPAEIRRDFIGTARYLGGILLIVGLGVWGVWKLWSFAQKFRLSNIRSRLEDPDIRAELAQRHGQSFLDHLDSENAEAEAEEIYDAKNSARRAAERHLRRQHAALKLQQSAAATGAATGAAAAKSRSPELEHAQQQQQQQQQQQPVPALHKQQQKQEPVQALDQPGSQQKPRHSLGLTPSASQAAAEKSGTSPYTAAAGSKSGLFSPSDTSSHVLHAPSSSAMSAATGLSAASSPEADKAASSAEPDLAASSAEADRAASGTATDRAASSAEADMAASSAEADKAVVQSRSSPPSSLPPIMHHETTASHQSNGATLSGPSSAPKPSMSDSEPESSVPASASAASRSDSLAESPPDTASISVDHEASEAATDEDKAVHADDSAADDPADDPAADVADDPVARQCPWVDSELLYFVTDDEGNPLNTILPAVGEAGVEQQQCFLAYEAHSDMLAMMYKTAALLPEGLVPTGLHPLMLLDACMGEGRPLAIVREGAAGGTERVTDAQEWLQQLAASAQILFADEMKYILMSRLDKIEELEAEFAAEGASHDAAEAESDGEADTKPDTEPAAAAAHVHKDPAPSTKHVDSTKSHASEMSAGASTNGQQGATPSGEREDAYAAMKKKQVVHLSKDVLNQLSQTSTQAQASTVASQPEWKPQSSAIDSPSQNGNGRHAPPSNNGNAWQSLSHVCVPLIENLQGDLGYVTADMAEGDAIEQHILAFQARSDADLVRHLVQAHLNGLEAKVSVVPMTSEQLQTRASEMDCHVTVYPPGQLQLKPGMTFEQLRQAAVAAR